MFTRAGHIYVATAASTNIPLTTSAQDFDNSSVTIPANHFSVGRMLRATLMGTMGAFSIGANAGNLILNVAGSSALTKHYGNITPGTINVAWVVLIRCDVAGASGTISLGLQSSFINASNTSDNGTTLAIDTTIANIIKFQNIGAGNAGASTCIATQIMYEWLN